MDTISEEAVKLEREYWLKNKSAVKTEKVCVTTSSWKTPVKPAEELPLSTLRDNSTVIVERSKYSELILRAKNLNETIVISPDGKLGKLTRINKRINTHKVISGGKKKKDVISIRETFELVLNDVSRTLVSLEEPLPLFTDDSLTEFSHFNTGKNFTTSTKDFRKNVKVADTTNKERECWTNIARRLINDCEISPVESHPFKFGDVYLYVFTKELSILATKNKLVVEVVVDGEAKLETSFWKEFEPYVPQK